MQSKIVADGQLEVFEDGTIYRIKKDNSKEIVKQSKVNNRMAVSIYENGKQKHLYVHRLVAEAFLPNEEKKPYVHHRDGDLQNNHVSNLEWITKQEQVAQAIPKTLKAREKICKTCGEITYSRDGICPGCKREKLEIERREKAEVKAHIKEKEVFDALKNINLSTLTENQRRIVTLRMEGLTLNQIGELMHVSKQRVDQVIGNALEKQGKPLKITHATRKNYLTLKNKLSKKKNMLGYLKNEVSITEQEIETLENSIVFYELAFGNLLNAETPAAGTAGESKEKN